MIESDGQLGPMRKETLTIENGRNLYLYTFLDVEQQRPAEQLDSNLPGNISEEGSSES